MKSRNNVDTWQVTELTAKWKGQHIYTSPRDAKWCVAERWMSPALISISASIFTKTGRGLHTTAMIETQRYIRMSLTHFCRSSHREHRKGTPYSNYLQQEETRISIIIYVQNLRVSGSAGDATFSKCPTNGKSWFSVGFRVVHNEMYCTSNKTMCV